MKLKKYSLYKAHNERLFYIIQLLPNNGKAIICFLDTLVDITISYSFIIKLSKEITLKQALISLKDEQYRNTLSYR